MPSLFGPAFDYILSWEDPGKTGKVTRDSGGLTRYGISSRAFPDLDIRNLKVEDAANLYRDNYFKPIRGYGIENQGVANKLCDMAVNMGVKEAVLLCQKSLCTLGLLVVQDGKMGPNTLEAINKADAEQLLGLLRAFSKQFYVDLCNKRPEYEKYLRGWIRRAEA